LYFYDVHGFSEIGFARRIFADFAHPAHKIPVLLQPSLVWIHAITSMGKNGTIWDTFEGFQSQLAMFGNEAFRGLAAR